MAARLVSIHSGHYWPEICIVVKMRYRKELEIVARDHYIAEEDDECKVVKWHTEKHFAFDLNLNGNDHN